jgi:hypothetical protein
MLPVPLILWWPEALFLRSLCPLLALLLLILCYTVSIMACNVH